MSLYLVKDLGFDLKRAAESIACIVGVRMIMMFDLQVKRSGQS
jgi:hypothetical protein